MTEDKWHTKSQESLPKKLKQKLLIAFIYHFLLFFYSGQVIQLPAQNSAPFIIYNNTNYNRSASVTQSCLTLWDPWTVACHGIFQARILAWVPISSSRGTSWPRDKTHNSCIGRQSLPLSHLGSQTIIILLLLRVFFAKKITCFLSFNPLTNSVGSWPLLLPLKD